MSVNFHFKERENGKNRAEVGVLQSWKDKAWIKLDQNLVQWRILVKAT
jgi:hypothetical protein